MIFEALQSVLLRFHFHLLRSKFQKIPEFNLDIFYVTLKFIVSWANLLMRILKADSQLDFDMKFVFFAILCKTVSSFLSLRVKSAPSSVNKCTTGL